MTASPTKDDLLSPRPAPKCIHRLLRSILALLPNSWKASLYHVCFRFFRPSRDISRPSLLYVPRLPFGLALKNNKRSGRVEADALRVIENRYPYIHAPFLLDYVKDGPNEFILSSWVEGEIAQDVWDTLSSDDVNRLAQDIHSQLYSAREVDQSRQLQICNASLEPMSDNRLQWDDGPISFDSWSEMAARIWIGFSTAEHDDLGEELRPIMARENVPIVFTHGDLAPWNMIFPGGVDKWKRGETRVVLIDWECAGWMPLYWDALEVGYQLFDTDDPYWEFLYSIFPESREVVQADYNWRSKSKITLF